MSLLKVCVQRFMCMKVWGVCVFGCDVFMCVVGTHVASVCAQMEGWRPGCILEWGCRLSGWVWCVREQGCLENPSDCVRGGFFLIGGGGVALGLGRGKK